MIAGPGRTPEISIRSATGPTRAVAIVLPGGKVNSVDPVGPRQLAVFRMLPFARLLHRRGHTAGLAVWTVRYRCQGWNGEQMSPVADVRWVLTELRRRHGNVPAVLIGHSMGGRAALRAAAASQVRGVLALAPWLPDDEPVAQLAGRSVLIAHGTLDSVTSPRASSRYALQAVAAGVTDIQVVLVRGDLHAMLLRWRRWNRLTTQFVSRVLGGAVRQSDDRWPLQGAHDVTARLQDPPTRLT